MTIVSASDILRGAILLSLHLAPLKPGELHPLYVSQPAFAKTNPPVS